VLPAGITGHAFEDLDFDGTVDSSEPAAPFTPNAPLLRPYLDLDHDGLLDPNEPAISYDDRGDFAFGNLAPGTYDVRLTLINGYAQSVPAAGGAAVVTVAAGERAAPAVLFGVALRPAMASGSVYLDQDIDGVHDAGEGPLAGVGLILDLNRDGVFSFGSPDVVTFSDAAGLFRFANLSPGTYAVKAIAEGAYAQTDPANGGTLSFSVDPSGAANGLWFGLARVFGSLSGTVSYEDGGTPAGWQVVVTPTANPQGALTGQTNFQGRWSVGSLPAGEYRVSLTVAIPSLELSSPAAPPHEYLVTIATGQDLSGLDFVLHDKDVTFTGSVFNDLNGNGVWETSEHGLPGVTVVYDRTSAQAVTDAQGQFTFNNVRPSGGGYTFTVIRPTRFLRTFPYTGQADTLWVPSAIPGMTQDAGLMGFQSPTSAFISGTAYLDANANGVRDAGEPPIANRTIGLDYGSDGPDVWVTTDSQGWYAFARLDPRGQYRISDVLPPDWLGTSPPNGGVRVVPFDDGGPSENNDFGSVPWAATGAVFNDLDADGVRDPGELGIAGRTVYLDLDADGKVDAGEPTATTGGDGRYGLLVSAAGTYRVRQVLPAGWGQSYPSNGAAQLAALAPGTTRDGTDFGASTAVAADTAPPVLSSAASIKTRGAATPVPQSLALTGRPTVESRSGGPSRLALTFDEPVVTGPAFAVSLSSGTVGSGGGAPAVAADGRTVAFDLSGVANAAELVVNIAGLMDGAGNAGTYQLKVGVLSGDVDGDGVVGPGDFNILATHFGQTGRTSADGDFDGDGIVGPGDFNLLATAFGMSLVRSSASLVSSANSPAELVSSSSSTSSTVANSQRNAKQSPPARPSVAVPRSQPRIVVKGRRGQ
jgi:hypothetical protein